MRFAESGSPQISTGLRESARCSANMTAALYAKRSDCAELVERESGMKFPFPFPFPGLEFLHYRLQKYRDWPSTTAVASVAIREILLRTDVASGASVLDAAQTINRCRATLSPS